MSEIDNIEAIGDRNQSLPAAARGLAPCESDSLVMDAVCSVYAGGVSVNNAVAFPAGSMVRFWDGIPGGGGMLIGDSVVVHYDKRLPYFLSMKVPRGVTVGSVMISCNVRMQKIRSCE